MNIFCKHDWEVISETTTKSKYEHAMEIIANRGASSVKLPWQMSDASRKLIQIVSCKKCGKLQRFVENI